MRKKVSTLKLMTAATVLTVSLGLLCGLKGGLVPFAHAGEHSDFSAQEWAVVQTLSPLPKKPAIDWTNAFADDPAAAKLGQELFFEPAIAGPLLVGTDKAVDLNNHSIPPNPTALGKFGETGKIACASCHQPNSGWMFDIRSNDGVAANPHATALGANWTVRNASSIINTAYYHIWHENDGIADSAWADALTDPEDPHSQNGSRLQVAHVLWNKYRDEYNAIFAHAPAPLDPRLDPQSPHASDFPTTGKPGDPQWEALSDNNKEIINRIYANFGKAIQAYLRLCVSRNAPFDDFVAGQEDAISTSAQRGLKLFISRRANCIACHNTPLFSDSQFHSIGLKIDTALSPHADPSEQGRFSAMQILLQGGPGTTMEFNVNSEYSDFQNTGFLDGLVANNDSMGAWRTKSLRQVAPTPPYMHDGQIPTLEGVVAFYNRGGDPEGTFFGVKEIKPIGLSAQESADLVAFLKTLTGEPLSPDLTKDTHHH